MQKPFSLHYFTFWLVLGWLQICVIIYLTLTPSPPDVTSFAFSDKIGHVAAYTIVMFWFAQLYTQQSQKIKLVVSFILMGIVLEFLQKLGGVRTLEIFDMLANSFGVLIGWTLAATKLSGILAGVERKLVIQFDK